jgi:hypothetical protein
MLDHVVVDTPLLDITKEGISVLWNGPSVLHSRKLLDGSTDPLGKALILLAEVLQVFDAQPEKSGPHDDVANVETEFQNIVHLQILLAKHLSSS